MQRLSSKYLAMGAAGIIGVAIIAIVFNHKPSAKITTAPQPPAVSTTSVAVREIVEDLPVSGELVARDPVQVVPDTQGLRVATISAETGDTVSKGQVLATLTRSTLGEQVLQANAAVDQRRAAAAEARAQLAKAQTAFDEAEKELARNKALLARGAVSQLVVDQQQANHDSAADALEAAREATVSADAAVKEASAQYKQSATVLDQTSLRAPEAGTIYQRSAVIGEPAAMSGTPLFSISRDGMIELDAVSPAYQLQRMKAGQPASIVLPDGTTISGTVRLVGSEIDTSTGLGHVRLAFPVDPRLIVGAYVQGSVEVSRQSLPSVPFRAVAHTQTGSVVKTVVDGKVVSKSVTTGPSDGNYIGILKGLSKGDIVIAKAGGFVTDGDPVTPVSIDPSKQDASK
ncbi:hypothetical protein HY29_17350 [Hyphomonas beringensis]|uniref:Uncharacterized protein n=1 Tax=Hyphomonas beringensis TaxID=1280946 RepID=A0A062UAU4_9PROT|nr:efflux RND transporter periplasmic adaptor subunit [Hyphomonas beringensis]KCZ53245.1 hypothetical protein HY29_17350 [Hyphomonas beringensis]